MKLWRQVLAAIVGGVILCFGCARNNDHAPPCTSPVLENVLRIETSLFGASGVYLGGGLVLTNWHVAVSSPAIDLDVPGGLPDEDYLRLFEVGGEGAALLADYYCFDEFGTYFRSADGGSFCTPVNLTPLHRYDASDGRAESRGELLYADVTLDLAIIRLAEHSEDAVLSGLPNVAIANRSPEEGDVVVIAGHPGGLYAEGECEVVSSRVRLIEDTNTSFPSDLVVPSFEADCERVGQGSSGSPVFDRDTGELLGVLWTVGSDGRAVISASSAWRARALNSDSTTLTEVLDRHPMCL